MSKVVSQTTNVSGRFKYSDNETTTVELGDDVFEVLLVTKEDRFLCPNDKCRKRFDSEHGLKQHLAAKHDYSAHKHLICKECSEEFVTKRHDSEFCSRSCASMYARREYGNCESCGHAITKDGICTYYGCSSNINIEDKTGVYTIPYDGTNVDVYVNDGTLHCPSCTTTSESVRGLGTHLTQGRCEFDGGDN